METFSAWPFMREIHRPLVISQHKGQWRGALMSSLICASINGWVNNGEAGDLRCHRTHYDVTVMAYHVQMSTGNTSGSMGKAQVTLCRSFFADVPDHSRPPRSVMIVTKPSDRGLSFRSFSVQDCQYDISTTAVRHWYDGSVWSTLSTFSTTISTTTDTIDTTARTMLTTTPTLLPICYHD